MDTQRKCLSEMSLMIPTTCFLGEVRKIIIGILLVSYAVLNRESHYYNVYNIVIQTAWITVFIFKTGLGSGKVGF